MFDVDVKSGTSTVSSVDVLLPFMKYRTANTARTATRTPMTDPTTIFLLRFFEVSARCSVRDFVATSLFGLGTATNWPVTGLNTWVAMGSLLGFMATVAVLLSGCLPAFILVKSVSGLNDAAIGTPPFIYASRSFLNSAAVA